MGTFFFFLFPSLLFLLFIKMKLIFLIFSLYLFIHSTIALSTSNYQNNKKVNDNYKVFWTVKNQKEISILLQVKNANWAGIGISEGGAMRGSDVVTGHIDENGVGQVIDRWRNIVPYQKQMNNKMLEIPKLKLKIMFYILLLQEI